MLVEGITLVDGPRYNVRALAQYTTIHGIEVMSWWFSTDGAVGGNHSLVENSFIKVNDDSIKLHWGDTIARRNVLWQLENGGTFNLSWNIHDDVQDFHVYDNDVIHAEHYLYEAEAVFRAALPAGSVPLAYPLLTRAEIELARGEFGAAHRTTMRIVALLGGKLPDAHPARLMADCRLARALAGLGHTAEARAALEAVVARMAGAEGMREAHRRECEEALAALGGPTLAG